VAAEGLLRSVTTLLGIDVGVRDHTRFSRRSPGLALAASLAQAQASGPVHVVIDATGLKVHGAGEAGQGSARDSEWNTSGDTVLLVKQENGHPEKIQTFSEYE